LLSLSFFFLPSSGWPVLFGVVCGEAEIGKRIVFTALTDHPFKTILPQQYQLSQSPNSLMLRFYLSVSTDIFSLDLAKSTSSCAYLPPHVSFMEDLLSIRCLSLAEMNWKPGIKVQ